MKTEFKDWHLYMGCDILRPDGRTILKSVGIIGGSWVFHEESGDTFGAVGPHNKLVLRPLSDMTEEETKEFYGMPFHPICSEVFAIKKNRAAETAYLLSKHFDLFNLIESGQAIDRSTLSTPTDKQSK